MMIDTIHIFITWQPFKCQCCFRVTQFKQRSVFGVLCFMRFDIEHIINCRNFCTIFFLKKKKKKTMQNSGDQLLLRLFPIWFLKRLNVRLRLLPTKPVLVSAKAPMFWSLMVSISWLPTRTTIEWNQLLLTHNSTSAWSNKRLNRKFESNPIAVRTQFKWACFGFSICFSVQF